MVTSIAVAAAALIVGVTAGIFLQRQRAQKFIQESQTKSKEILLEAKNEALKLKEEAEQEKEKKEAPLKELETSLRKREEGIDKRLETVEKERRELSDQAEKMAALRKELEEAEIEKQKALSRIAKLKKEEARELLISAVEKEYKDDIIKKIRQAKEEVREQAEIEARKILSTVIQRIASEHTSEHTAMTIHLPNEEMKGRIIGKEGRNIQIFEKLTGVDLIVDETPDTVLISSFDPVRRHIARRALERLIADGRIQPARIEDVVKRAEKEVKKEMKEAGEAAVIELGVTGLHPDLIRVIGALSFRTSYGQNILRHSIEVAHIAALLAKEIGADVGIVKKAALLHDVGKALSHELQGAHHHISGDIAKKYGMSEAVVHAAIAHHDDIEPKTVEALLVKAADAISGARPGARKESADSYVRRLSELENIAAGFEGVEKAYAIQAGREIRVIVKPTDIDDLGALKLSKNIARKVEESLQYPGTIKVNVIRETRAVEYAK